MSTTTTLHANLQRSRFGHLILEVLAGIVAPPWRLPARTARPARPAPSVAEAAAREAQKVRDLAYSYTKTDPGFAADLYAAAARHESLHES